MLLSGVRCPCPNQSKLCALIQFTSRGTRRCPG
jgi:hypothetical protein